MLSKPRFVSLLYSFNLLTAIILVVLLPFCYSFTEYIVLILFFSTYFFELLFSKQRRTVVYQQKQILYLIFILFFSLIVLYYFKETNLTYYHRLLEKRLPILAFGIIGFFGFNPKYKLKYFSHAFILSSTLIILYLVCIKIGIITFIQSEFKGDIFRLARNESVNAHMLFNFHLNTSLIFLIYFIFKVKTKITLKGIYVGFGILIYSILFISEGRSGFIASNMLLITLMIYLLFRWKMKAGFIFLVLAPIMLYAVISHHPRVSKKEFTTENRLLLWGVTPEIMKQQPILGYGASSAEQLFMDKVRTINNPYFNQTMDQGHMLDCHNQFIQVEMEFGILGLLLLLAIYIYPLFVVEGENRIFLGLFLLISIFQSCFDMFITGQFSILFFLVTLLFLNLSSNESTNALIPDKS